MKGKYLIFGGLAAIAAGGVISIVNKLKGSALDGTAEDLMMFLDADITDFSHDQLESFTRNIACAYGSYQDGADYKVLSAESRDILEERFFAKYKEATRMIADKIKKSGASS